MVGSILSNRYEISEKLGEGGMAVVYRGKDRVLGRRVAVKVLRPQYAADTDFVERFRREAQAAASLSHPNVVNIFDVGTDGDVHYIVMEYVEGHNLKEILRRDGPLPLDKVLHIGTEVCRALEAAHRQGLIHRDIKPHNILVTRDDVVKVTDFGIARAASTATLTHTGTVIGSVHYLSPEQATGGQVGVYTDIYAVGVLLYEMVTGRVPFDGESPVAVALKHLHDAPPSMRADGADVPPELERIILRAMAKDPAQRFKDTTEMLAELRRVPLPPPEDARKPAPAEPNGGEDAAAAMPAAPSSSSTSPPVEPPHAVPPGTAAAWEGDGPAEETTIVRAPKSGMAGPAPGQVPAEEGEQVPRDKKRKRSPAFRVLLWLVVLLSFASGAMWAGVTFFERLFPEDVVVPPIVGLSVDAARAALNEHGLSLRVVREVNSDEPVNTVVRQIPDAGRTVKMGREIDVHVSIGQEMVTVPELLNVSQREAELRIAMSGLEAGAVEYEYRPDLAPNLVVAQTPPAGARVQRGSRVDLVLSTGAAPVALVEVPDFTGVPLSEAAARVQELGLVLGQTFGEMDSRFQPGQVIDQAPSPGTRVEVGTAVNFVYYPLPSGGDQGGQPWIQPGEAEVTDDGDTIVRSIITVHVPPGPKQEVVIVVIDNISARRVFHNAEVPGDSVVRELIRGYGRNARYQVWIGGELYAEGLIAQAR